MGQRIHFIGIGGVGMSGIALVAIAKGNVITGSDLRASKYTEEIEEAGGKVYIGQFASNIDEAKPDVVVVSTAIQHDNPELVRAKELGIKIWHRAQMLAFLGEGKTTFAVCGTHGKTTTSSMLATVLDVLGDEPSFLIGGMVEKYGNNAHYGKGQPYVIEADESDKSFTWLNPTNIILTNIEADHLDHYTDLAEIKSCFGKFLNIALRNHGVIAYCKDDENANTVVNSICGKDDIVVSYGTSADADVSISRYCVNDGCSISFMVTLPDGIEEQVTLPQNPGVHNARNAAGVIALLWKLGYDVEKIIAAISLFSGVGRRFTTIGSALDIHIVDDYAHHPTEIAATIAAARSLGYRKVHVLFQPHRYSRLPLFTEVLRDGFANAFNDADTLTFMDVYAAGEKAVEGVDGGSFLAPIKENPAAPPSRFVRDRHACIARMCELAEPGDIILTMGAGDVTMMGPQILEVLRQKDLEMTSGMRTFLRLRDIDDVNTLMKYLYFDRNASIIVTDMVTDLKIRMGADMLLYQKSLSFPDLEEKSIDSATSLPTLFGYVQQLKRQQPVDATMGFKSRWDEIEKMTQHYIEVYRHQIGR